MDNDEQIHRTLNGRSVMNAILRFGDQATVDNLSKYIATSTDQDVELIKPEVERVLLHGIRNGFLVKQEQHYLPSGHSDLCQVDRLPQPDPPDPLEDDADNNDEDDDPYSELAQFVIELQNFEEADIEIVENEVAEGPMTEEEFLQAQAELILILEGDVNDEEAATEEPPPY